MKKIKTYPNHLEIITSVFIPYKDFDLEVKQKPALFSNL